MKNKFATIAGISGIILFVAGFYTLLTSDTFKDKNVIVADQGTYKTYIRYITVDGCQYLEYGHALTHKGNCTNSFHFSK